MNALTCHAVRANRAVLMAATITLSIAAIASASSPQPSLCQTSEKASLVSMADPSALYCEGMGYKYRVLDEKDGQRGVCMLPDGREVDAWEFYRGKVAPEYSYCAREGYGIRTRIVDEGDFVSECAVCVAASGEELGTVAELMRLELGPVSALERGMERALERPSGPGEGRSDGMETEDGDRTKSPRYVPRHVAVPFGGSPPNDALPEEFDWRVLDGCTAVKSQGNCGSCWAFSTVGALECNILIRDGTEVDLSEQWLVSCNQEGWSCGGGGFGHRYHMLTTDPCGGAGAVLERDFPYVAANAPCDCPYPHVYTLDGWGYIDPSVEIPDPELIKRAIMEYGPISVGVQADAAFSNYNGGIFTGSIYHDINHAVVLVGWDDDQGIDGIWYLRNSWGTMWGERGYMRIARGRNAVGWYANWVDYRDPIEIFLDEGTPGVIDPGQPTSITARIETRTDSYVQGSASIHYRSGGEGYSIASLEPLGGGQYRAVLPAFECGDSPEFFFSAAGLRFGAVYYPPAPMESPCVSRVGITTPVFHDDFEADLGWTVANGIELVGGAWERGVPVGGGDRSDPPTDCDGSGSCYLTGNTDGDSDVDKDWTRLISPIIDISAGEEAVVDFAYWYRNDRGDNPNGDYFIVCFSDDGGANWVEADAVGPRAPLPVGWKRRTIPVSEHVALTSGFRVRIQVADEPGGSLVEAAVDDFTVSYLSCGESSATGQAVAQVGHAAGVNGLGADAVSGGAADVASTGAVPTLLPNAPNPFSPSTTIGFRLPRPATVTLTIVGPSGRVIRTLLDAQPRGAGEHQVVWDGNDDHGRHSASGVYFYRLGTGDGMLAEKMILLR
ncbi:MAG: DUF333 domain-containing protein [Candidatus Eisenbacteria bacterium]|nr:DUF333 domain-containing protein [Candidatus Eisenbacteria bacterium]